MRFLQLTLESLNENLALDEALLVQVDAGALEEHVLRIWEPQQPAVVLGRGSKIADEVDTLACQSLDIPLGRRCSGGASIVTGRGCLMYGVVINLRKEAELRSIDKAHRWVMQHLVDAMRLLGANAQHQGICDLTYGGRKVSGNSLRCLRNALLYHGTLLYDFNLNLISRCLTMPPRQPEYRRQRSHAEFIGQLPHSAEDLVRALRSVWNANEVLTSWPHASTQDLATRKYADQDWTLGGRDPLR